MADHLQLSHFEPMARLSSRHPMLGVSDTFWNRTCLQNRDDAE